MKWTDHDSYSVAGPYKIHRGIKYWSVSYEGEGEYALVNNRCESRSQAKALAMHDWELRERAQAL